MTDEIKQTEEEQRKARLKALVVDFFHEHWRGKYIDIESYVLSKAKNNPLLDRLSYQEIREIPKQMVEELRYDSATDTYILRDSRFLDHNQRMKGGVK
jgi:hypothetical protein